MSTIAYAIQTRRAEDHPVVRPSLNEDDNDQAKKASALAQRLAALVPAEVLLVFGFALTNFTSTESDGSTTITKPGMLKWSIPLLAGFSLIEYLLAKGSKPKKADFGRMLVPPLAFVAWTLLTGSTALMLWGWFEWVQGAELYVGGFAGIVALFLAVVLTPSDP